MWLVVQGESPSNGAYLRYPLRDMLGLLALEAWRHQAIVVGENLGTVLDGFNQGLQEKGMLGMSVLWFQRGVQAYAAGSAASFKRHRSGRPGAWPCQIGRAHV